MTMYCRDIGFYTTIPEAGRRLKRMDHEIRHFEEFPKPHPKALNPKEVPATVS